MNFEYFIAKRLVKGKEHKSSISATIIKIAIVAIAIGLIMMLITVATSIGLQRKIREKVAAFNGHIVINSYDNNDSMESLVPLKINQPFYPRFNDVTGIEYVQAFATKAGVIRTETEFEGVVLKGVVNDYNWDYFKEYVIEGRLPDLSNPRNSEVMISALIANRLGLKLGDKATTFFLKKGSNSRANIRNFEIVGVYDSGFQEFDEKFIFADIRHIQTMNGWEENEVGGFEVYVQDFDKISEKGKEVYQSIPSDLESRTIAEKYISIFEWLKLFDLNVIGIIGIIILVSGINMITALLVLILERTQMIGILKSLGATNYSIRKVFLYNAAYLIAVGLFWGNVLGLGILLVQKYYGVITLNPATYYVDTAPVHVDFLHVILLNIGTLILCLVMLIIPSYVISKISPSRSIRFE